MGEMGGRRNPRTWRGEAYLGVDIFRGDITMVLADHAHVGMGKGGERITDQYICEGVMLDETTDSYL